MRTRPSPDNPYGYSRWGFAWEHVPRAGRGHLDFGCGDGAFLASLRAKAVGQLVGVDISRDAVAAARARFPDLDVRHIGRTAPLDFPDGAFSSVTLMDVLEHVHEQADLLAELRRILAGGGLLIVTVPRRGVFSCLDMGNWKFRFPRLHRWCYLAARSREDYERRYVAGPDGLVGDVSARKRWHEHFSQAGLAAVLGRAGFEPVAFDGSSLLARPLAPLAWLMRKVPVLRLAARVFEQLDGRLFRSMNLFCLARPKPHPKAKGTAK